MHSYRKQKKKRGSGRFMLPWWCCYIGWLITLVCIGGSIFLVLSYGITFGQIKCTKWISSLLFSFLSSALFIQPLKVRWVLVIKVCFINWITCNDSEYAKNTHNVLLIDNLVITLILFLRILVQRQKYSYISNINQYSLISGVLHGVHIQCNL